MLNIYDSKHKGSYDWHYDSSKSDMYDVKLTVLVNLSEKYTGGKFHIFHGDEYVVEEFEPGTLLLFKSNLNHKVSPVLTGVRKTLTLLINGPKFR
jgi:PKHD-type hydroxylase